MTDNEIIKALECHKDEKNSCEECTYECSRGCSLKLAHDALDLIKRQKAEIERLQGCVKTEDEVKAIMESQMQSSFDLLFSDHLKRAMKLSRDKTICDFVEWLLSLFPEDKSFTTISKFTVKQKFKEMAGADNA